MAAVDQPAFLVDARSVHKAFAGVPALIDGRLRLKAGSVHALLGGNGAGKSTFLNVLMGIYAADGGAIEVKGRPVRYVKPADALADGIAMITQELSVQRDMTVAENIHLGTEPRRGGLFVDDREMMRRTRALLDDIHFPLDPKATMRKLSVAQQQLVEIAKAINRRGAVLIMDEPTSAIGNRETEMLFDAIRALRARGIGIIYVSHRLTDIFSVADEYTVFRDGSFVETGEVQSVDKKRLIQSIVGRTLRDVDRSEKVACTDVLFEARDFSLRGHFSSISMQVNKGEAVGIFGLMGAGRSEFANAIFGLIGRDTGEIRIAGRPTTVNSPQDAIASGMALVTEDRKETGLVLSASVRANISLPALGQLSRLGIVRRRAESLLVRHLASRFHVKAHSSESLVQHLSGGNQQKVVLAKCISTKPRILICDEPTRGVDEGAKREIYLFLQEFVAEGHGVLFISSEVPELIANTDRIIVFRSGRIVAEVRSRDVSQDQLLHLAS